MGLEKSRRPLRKQRLWVADLEKGGPRHGPHSAGGVHIDVDGLTLSGGCRTLSGTASINNDLPRTDVAASHSGQKYSSRILENNACSVGATTCRGRRPADTMICCRKARLARQ